MARNTIVSVIHQQVYFMTDPSLPAPLHSDELLAVGLTIKHGFFTSQGGVSNGIYRSLNVGLGSKDDGERVAENRALVCRALGGEEDQLATVYQYHSSDVVVAEHAWGDPRPKADAIVTKVPGLVIGILTADCGPVLFADSKAGIIGAAHAGWKGAKNGVLENTVEAMIALGARRECIVATLGPSISQKNYEVGPEFEAHFVALQTENRRYFSPSDRNDHHMFDLGGFIVDRLSEAGVQANSLGVCTYEEAAKLYSYRRATHRNESDYGRQISAIMLQKHG
jgi:YfiH family protein